MGKYTWSFPTGMKSQITSGKIALNPPYSSSSPYSTDGAFEITVSSDATPTSYIITCSTDSCTATGTCKINDCGGGGGDTCDGRIKITETQGRGSGEITLPTSGGDLNFNEPVVCEATGVGEIDATEYFGEIGRISTTRGAWIITVPDDVTWIDRNNLGVEVKGNYTAVNAKLFAQEEGAPSRETTVTVECTGPNCQCSNTMSFKVKQKGTSPTPPVGDCPDYGTSYDTNDSLETIFTTELNCLTAWTKTNDWRATSTNCDGKTCETGWTVTINNKTHLNQTKIYVPFNGIFRILTGSTAINIVYRVYNAYIEPPATGFGSHYWYGATADRSQDTNFLVPPGYKVELSCVRNFEATDASSTRFELSYMKNAPGSSSPKDYKLHNTNVAINTIVDEVDITNKKLTFTVTGGSYWDATVNEYSYGIRESDYENNKCSVFVKSNGYKYLVPINVFRSSSSGNWNGYDPLDTTNLPGMTFTKL